MRLYNSPPTIAAIFYSRDVTKRHCVDKAHTGPGSRGPPHVRVQSLYITTPREYSTYWRAVFGGEQLSCRVVLALPLGHKNAFELRPTK